MKKSKIEPHLTPLDFDDYTPKIQDKTVVVMLAVIYNYISEMISKSVVGEDGVVYWRRGIKSEDLSFTRSPSFQQLCDAINYSLISSGMDGRVSSELVERRIVEEIRRVHGRKSTREIKICSFPAGG